MIIEVVLVHIEKKRDIRPIHKRLSKRFWSILRKNVILDQFTKDYQSGFGPFPTNTEMDQPDINQPFIIFEIKDWDPYFSRI